MAGRDPPRGLDPDDWFAGAGQASPRSSGGTTTSAADHDSRSGEEEDWLEDRPLAVARDRVLASLKADRRLAVAAGVIVVALLIAGLWVGGVFSGGGNRATTSTTTPVTTTTPTSPHTVTPVATPAPTTTLKPGDTGAQVKVLQRALTHLGYSVGTIDGDYGAATTAAVKQFQSASNLTADGLFGPATKTALATALNAG